MNKFIGNIVNRILNKEYLNNDVIKQIAESNFKFLSDQSKELLLTYINSNDPLIAIDLWKNLLIDSICILKVNDSREKLYNDSKDLELFVDNFSKIRKSSSFGIDEIVKYFADFIEFERVLYGTDEHYRDHVDHVLQVWAIGISLICHNEFILDDGYIINSVTEFHFEILDSEDKKNEISISKSEYWSMWTIISLCHDLGYPIEKTAKINKQAKKIISHFGNMNFSELNYSFDIFNTFLVDKFLNVISSKADFYTDLNCTVIQTKYRDKFSKSLEDYKHGIFSSLLLFKNLTYFLETDYFVSKSNLNKEDLRQFFIRKEILRSIAGHTCPKIYHINLNTLSFLLILSDELQEWNRPNFNEFKYKIEGKEPTVEIKEFDMIGKQKIHICFKYDFEFKEIEIKNIVNRKFKNIHCLLRSAKDDKNRKIYFKWEIETKDKKYIFCFDSNENSFNQLDIKIQTRIKDNKFNEAIRYELYD